MTNTCIDKEQERMDRVLNFRLPARYKKLGLYSAVLILLVLFAYKFMGSNAPLLKDILRTLVLFFLLIASLSKDKLEDEYNRHMRFQSFVIAFVVAVAYAVIIPLISIVIDFAITNISGNGNINFYEISAFEVIFILLGIQLLSFETLKRIGRAQ